MKICFVLLLGVSVVKHFIYFLGRVVLIVKHFIGEGGATVFGGRDLQKIFFGSYRFFEKMYLTTHAPLKMNAP